VHLLVKILDPHPGDEVVDPACGSGGMLVETVNAVRAAGSNPDSLRLHGQEVNLTTSAIAKMNLYLHGLRDFEIRRGDTFRDPQVHRSGPVEEVRRGDCQSTVQPAELGCGQRLGERPVGTRAVCAAASEEWRLCVDPAHDRLHEGRQRTRRCGHAARGAIPRRQGGRYPPECLLEKDLLEAVIGLPNNLFYSTSIPVCLLIWRKTKAEGRRGRVLFVDASKRFVPGKNQNSMSDADVEAIHAAYARGEDIGGEGGVNLRLVDMGEIAGKGFDLNIGRYIQAAATAEVDVEAALAAYREAREALRSSERVLDQKLKAAGFDA
jgi:type I restriction enzyme M protein